MPLASCPSCRNELDVPAALLRGPVRCANCLTVFTPVADVPTIPVAVPARSTSVPHDVFPDEPTERPSRRWLWVLLIGVTLIAFTCFGSCAGLIGVMSNPAMKPFTAEDGSFTANFPGNPKPVVRTTPDGRDVGGVEFVRELPGEEHYFVEFVELTDAEKQRDAPSLAAEAIVKWVKDQDGVVHETDTLDHKGLPASQIQGQIGMFKGGNVVAKAMRDGDRIYVVGVSGSVLPWNDRVRKFLDGFTPTGAPDKDRPPEQPPPPKKGGKKNPFKGD